MAVEETVEIVQLKNDFYKDGFYKVLFALGLILVAMGALIAVSCYLFFSKPKPVVFSVDNDWRVLPPVPVNLSYISAADLLQWVSGVVPSAFTYDFVNYSTELAAEQANFTANGWSAYQGHVNTYANRDTVEGSKLFVYGVAGGAPIIVNQALSAEGIYTWLIQMPVIVSNTAGESQTLTVQVVVVRVPTTDDLNGVRIDNMIVTQSGGNRVSTNG